MLEPLNQKPLLEETTVREVMAHPARITGVLIDAGLLAA